MQPFFFDGSAGRLFGIYHRPSSRGWRDRGIVICPPMGHEYIRAHRASVRLAALLNASGFPVFRFDYFATGDSEGETREGTVSIWRRDVADAIHKLRELSGVPKVSLVGMRLGAAIAATIGPAHGVSSVLLWDPVVDGKRYLEAIEAAHDRAFPRYAHRAGGRKELAGFEVTGHLLEEVAAIELCAESAFSASRAAVVVSEDNARNTGLRAHLHQLGIECSYHCVPDARCGWGELEGPMLWPLKLLDAIVDTLAKERV